MTLSLSTRNYRQAEHLAILLDRNFVEAVHALADRKDLKDVLPAYLKDALLEDLARHQNTPPGHPIYRLSVEADEDPADADLEIVETLLGDAREALARHNYGSVAKAVDELMNTHGFTEDQSVPLAHGILRANVDLLETALQRLNAVFPPLERAAASTGGEEASEMAAEPTASPKLSEVLPGFLDFMVNKEGWRGQTLHQNRPTYRMFMDICGDRPIQSYTRQDLTRFYDILRALPGLSGGTMRYG